MKILTLGLFIFFLLTVKSFACSCTPKVYAPSCELISKREVVFLGEPVEYSGGIYRFKVEKAYKGIESEIKEVKVYGLKGTSCEQQYSIGVKYLIFAGKSANTGNLITTMCSGSRAASQWEVDYLDRYSKGETQTVVYGQVLQWVTRFGLPDKDESNPVEGASLILENKDQKYTATSDSDGNFTFMGIDSGNYKLSAKKTPFQPFPASYDISVSKGGCQYEFVQLKAMAAIEGTLLYPDGSPAKNKRMELLRKNSSGEWYSAYYMHQQTDERGRFKFDELETGEYLLGYEIWGDYPDSDSPYPTTYFPGAGARNQAQTVTLSPNQIVSNLTLKLLAKQTPRNIRIKVIFPDASLSAENLLQFWNYNQPLGALKLKSIEDAVLNFKGYKEREYQFEARFWLDGIRGNRLIESEPVKIGAGGDTEVTLILSKIK